MSWLNEIFENEQIEDSGLKSVEKQKLDNSVEEYQYSLCRSNLKTNEKKQATSHIKNNRSTPKSELRYQHYHEEEEEVDNTYQLPKQLQNDQSETQKIK